MKVIVVILSVIFVLTGCASAPAFNPPAASVDKVTIYAFRTSSIVGGANSDIVAVNDQFIGRLNSGTYAVYEMDEGEVSVSRKAGSILGSGDSAGWGLGGLVGAVDGFREVVRFVGRAGSTYFVRFPHGTLVENAQALELMGGLENVTPARSN